MWSVGDQGSISSSSMTTSSSSSSSSPFSPSALFSMQRSSNKRTMEEVWKDISLNNLQENPLDDRHESYREMILQDFLASPNNSKEPQSSKRSNLDPVDIEPYGNNLSLFNSAASSTVLSKSSGNDLQRVNWLSFQSKNNPSLGRTLLFPQSENQRGAGNCMFPGETDVSGLSFCKRRLPESGTEEDSSDRRHKRMIKNRESAARSRARKQAYINELENEKAQLTDENAKLKEQQQQQDAANSPAMQVLQAKRTLWRTLTAPF